MHRGATKVLAVLNGQRRLVMQTRTQERFMGALEGPCVSHTRLALSACGEMMKRRQPKMHSGATKVLAALVASNVL